MSKVKADFENMASNLVAKGKHRARIEVAEEREGKNSGEKYIHLQHRLVDEPYAGRCCFSNVSLQPTALWKLKELLAAAGLPSAGSVDIDTDDLIDKEIVIIIDHAEFNGTPQEEVVGYEAV